MDTYTVYDAFLQWMETIRKQPVFRAYERAIRAAEIAFVTGDTDIDEMAEQVQTIIFLENQQDAYVQLCYETGQLL